MKKAPPLLFFLSLILIVALSACGERSGTPTQTEALQTEAETMRTSDTEP